MPVSKDGETPGEFNLDQALGGLFKGVGAVLDVLAEALDSGGAHSIRSTSHDRMERQPPIEMREPLIDVFEEGHEFLLVIELRGVQADDIRIAVQDDILDLETAGEHHYMREFLLPSIVNPATLRWIYRNGILQVRLEKWDDDDPIGRAG